MTRLQPPAYWLTANQAQAFRDHFQHGRSKEVGSLLRSEAFEVPVDGDAPSATMYGELINLLAGYANVPLPETLKTGASQDIEMYWQSGVCILFDGQAAGEATDAIREFMRTATDDVLSGGDNLYLILHRDEPEVVRAAIDFLYKLLDLPAEYDAALLVMR